VPSGGTGPADLRHPILQAIAAIDSYTARGTLDDTLVLDAVQLNLIKIGEAVAALPDSIREQEPGIPWKQIVGMRNELTHAYFFRVSPAIIRHTVEHDLGPLRDATQRILSQHPGHRFASGLGPRVAASP
jgi:uncharacterized protein with HEPN domain